MIERRPALGKGLSALIPDAPEPPRAWRRWRSTSICWRRTISSRACRWTTPAAGAGRIDQGQRHHSADPGAPHRHHLSHHRRRAPLARGAACRPARGPGRRPRRRGDKQLLELALIENIQRENLNPVDEALAYQRLADEFALTQDQIAAAVGKDRSSVANFMRLLRLPEEVRADLASGALSMGHARALLALTDAPAQRHAAREVISRGLSVRDTELLVKKLGEPPGTARRRPRTPKATSTPEPPRIGCVSLLGRKSGSSAGEAGAYRDRFRLGKRAETGFTSSC